MKLRKPSGKEALILELLSESEGMPGHEMVDASGGELKRGTVYVTLGRMADKGWVESWQEKVEGASGLPRRLFKVTELGRQALSVAASPPSRKEAFILKLLSQNGQMYGLEMVQASGGELKRGTVYVTLGRMATKGWVESWQERVEGASGLPRRVFRVTKTGRKAIKGYPGDLEDRSTSQEPASQDSQQDPIPWGAPKPI